MCPRCKEALLRVKKVRGGSYFYLSCPKCKIYYFTSVNVKDEFEAYQEFKKKYTFEEREKKYLKGRDKVHLPENTPEIVKEIALSPDCELVFHRFYSGKKMPVGGEIDESPLSQGIIKALKEKGISRLYRYQEEAVKYILEGKDTVIVAPTGTGKTEAFALPILQISMEMKSKNQYVKALFIYPTKSLARDQVKKLKDLCKYLGLKVEVFDGDVPYYRRKKIIEEPPDIVLTNFDVIDYHLRNHTDFSRIISRVKFIVVDEMHQYIGAFGSNAHYILKRIERVSPGVQFIGASATIANPEGFSRDLFGRKTVVVREESGRRGDLHVIMIYPRETGSTRMTVSILRRFINKGYKTLVFTNSHLHAELLNKAVKKAGIKSDVHRAGLSKKHRVEVEEKFIKNQLNVLVCTPTLELGIDIGDLDSILSFPVGFTRFLQRIGRAARKEGQVGIAVLALREDNQISLYYREKPEDFFKDVDHAYIEPRNPIIARYQLISAAMDKPIERNEFPHLRAYIEKLIEEEFLVRKSGKVLPNHMKARKALRNYNIRGIGESVDIYLDNKRIGYREMPLAARELFPGAIYLHGGKIYRSTSFQFKWGRGKAKLVPLGEDYPYFTIAKRYTLPKIIEKIERNSVNGNEFIYCSLKIKEVVDGYFLKDIHSRKTVRESYLQEPIEYSFPTYGLVFKAPQPVQSIQRTLKEGKTELNINELIQGAFHALEHVLVECSNMLTGGGSREMGGVSLGDTGYIFVYDSSPGGSGVSRLLFQRFKEALSRAAVVLDKCRCNRLDGCPLCTYSYRCGNNNKPLFKKGALESAKKMLEGEASLIIGEIPSYPEAFA